MRKIAILFALTALSSFNLKAQIIWSTNSNGINYNGGNVGIGATVPTAKLEVAGKIFANSGSNAESIISANGGREWQFIARANGNSTFAIRDNSIGADRLNIDLNGNVGIGAIMPTAKLEVAGKILANSGSNAESIISANGGREWQFIARANGNSTLAIRDNSIGADRLNIDLNGNIGIGTATPNSILTIKSSSPLVNITDGGTYEKHLMLGFDHTNLYGWLQSTWEMNSYRPLVLQRDGGNVGIGTTNPESIFTVQKSVSGGRGGEISIINLAPFATGNEAALNFGLENSTYGNNDGNAQIKARLNGLSGASTDLIFSLWSGSSFNEYMKIRSNGNVGIGTSTPSGLLSIGENNQELNFLSNKKLTGSWPPVAENSTFTIQSSGYQAGNLAFATGNAEVMRITSNGNVGIGVTNPWYKLTVEGTIAAREVKVTAEPWADFVFHPTYKLRTLGEVEQFIKSNSHLPEIPTAAEVKENGVSLGEMNVKLLQKVEELTLYLIEQQKVNEKQNQLIKMLEQKIEEIITKQ